MSESLQGQPSEAAQSSAGFSADLSAWMDGELSGSRARLVYRGMMADESRRAQWGRYHLIGDALRGSLPDHAMVDISAAVMARLDDTPVQVAGLRLTRNPRLWGLAASLVLAAVIVANPWHQQESRQDVQIAQIETAPATPMSVSSETGNADDDEALAQTRLESYLRNHSQALADAGEGARMLPYLSMAEYTVDPVAASSP